MREILFKAKRIDTGEWVEGCLIISDEQKFIMPLFGLKSVDNVSGRIGNRMLQIYAYEIDSETICQYTGLTDKNGKEIWENDVVRYSWTDGQDGAETEVATVKYDNYGYTPYIWEYDCDGCCLRCETLEVEVIGNIFDNPELMEGE